MAITENELIQMLRNVTGRVDASDPMFTNEIMGNYLNQFIKLQSTQDVRIFKNQTWYEFTIDENSPDPFPVDLQTIVLQNGAIGASTIGPPVYADGFTVFFYENPAEFYAIWPETQEYQPQRPTYVLYYNNQLTFRGPPNQEYLIKMAAYQVEYGVDPNGTLNQDYLYRYFVYGTALDIFADFGEMDKYRDIFPVFQRYRALVYARTNCQYQSQRTYPDF
jgi:hypothetical protein